MTITKRRSDIEEDDRQKENSSARISTKHVERIDCSSVAALYNDTKYFRRKPAVTSSQHAAQSVPKARASERRRPGEACRLAKSIVFHGWWRR